MIFFYLNIEFDFEGLLFGSTPIIKLHLYSHDIYYLHNQVRVLNPIVIGSSI